MERKEYCGKCKFFERDEYLTDVGYCVRLPPSCSMNGDARWPRLHETRRCGEFKPQPRERA